MSQEGGVSARCAATVPAATHAPKPHPTSSFFVILCACPGIFARKKTRRRDPRSARARALVADAILPPAPDPSRRSARTVEPRASSKRRGLPRPRARANAHRKPDGSSAKRPRQRRGSRAMAPRGGRACRAFHKNTGWNPTRGNLEPARQRRRRRRLRRRRAAPSPPRSRMTRRSRGGSRRRRTSGSSASARVAAARRGVAARARRDDVRRRRRSRVGPVSG